jgi:apolipoprotein N-acyltransferase
LLGALVGGALVGISLPPIGEWPMAVVGIAAIAWALAGRSLRSRLGVGMLAGIGQFSISLAWAVQFNTAGYVALVLVEALFIAVACVLVPPGRGRLPALTGALVLAEFARESWPFGGLPLGGLPLGQAGGPIGATARVGGPLLVVGVTVLAGAALAALLPTPALAPAPATAGTTPTATAAQPTATPTAELSQSSSRRSSRKPRSKRRSKAKARRAAAGATARARGATSRAGATAAGLIGAAAAAAISVAGVFGPNGTTAASPPARPTIVSGGNAEIRVAIVQGGGKRGLTQLQVPPSVVFAAAVNATRLVPPGVQLILWPEDVVGLNQPFLGSGAEKTMAAIARSHDATLVGGVTYPVGATQFRNEIVAFSPKGVLVATFEKVHRVPFGEYVPDRGFFKHLANLKNVPRDAIAGDGSGMIATPVGRAAVLVSYEVFFANRGRSGVRAGGRIIFVPTNTSSYTSEQAPSQEIAASRLQAIEEGRYVLQAAPTGYSAVVDNEGNVLNPTPLSSRAILTATVPLLSGATWYERFGDEPVLLGSLVLVAAGWLLALSRRNLSRRGRQPRHRRTSPSS